LKKEPKNLSNLDRLLKILKGATLPNELIAKLASRKCIRIKDLERVARWFAMWIRVDPKAAIASFQARIVNIDESKNRTKFAMTFITHLWDRGIFLLVYLGNKTAWELPDRDNRVNFTELIAALQEYWLQLSPKFPNVDEITIIGIDLTKRSS
jgi:hypothetical protein